MGVLTHGKAAQRLDKLMAGQIPPECHDVKRFIANNCQVPGEEATSANINLIRIAGGLWLTKRAGNRLDRKAARELLLAWLAKDAESFMQGEPGSDTYGPVHHVGLHHCLDAEVLLDSEVSEVVACLGRHAWWSAMLNGRTLGSRCKTSRCEEWRAWFDGEHPKLDKWRDTDNPRAAWVRSPSWRRLVGRIKLVPPRLKDPILVVYGNAGGFAIMPFESKGWDKPGTVHVAAWRSDGQWREVWREPRGDRRLYERGPRGHEREIREDEMVGTWNVGHKIMSVVVVDATGAHTFPGFDGVLNLFAAGLKAGINVAYRSPSDDTIGLWGT